MKKYFCDLKTKDGYIRKTAKEIYDIKQNNPILYESEIKDNIYSTHTNKDLKLNMYVKRINEKSYFSYFPNSLKLIPREYINETITHSIFKDIISKLKTIKLKSDGEIVSFDIESSSIEYKVEIDTSLFYTDIYFKLKENEMNLDELYFEILFSHEVDTKKNFMFKEKNYLIFEFKVPNKLSFEDLNNDEDFISLITYIEKSLNDYIPGNFINL